MSEAAAPIVVNVEGLAVDAQLTTPWASPLFLHPPYVWHGTRMIGFPFTVAAGVAETLPPGMELMPGPGAVGFIRYPATEVLHPYCECAFILPVRVGAHEGNFVPFIYVTTDEALAIGREVYGWPKKIADITWEAEGDHLAISVSRFGETPVELSADMTGPLADAMLQMQADVSGRPSLNYKLIPGPDGKTIEVEEITSTLLDVVPHAGDMGTAKVVFRNSRSEPIGDLVGGDGGSAGDGAAVEGIIFAMDADLTIPAGDVVARIERGGPWNSPGS